MRYAQAGKPNGKAVKLVAVKWQGESSDHATAMPDFAVRYNITFYDDAAGDGACFPHPRRGFAAQSHRPIGAP